MMILSQHHIFKLDTINIYSVKNSKRGDGKVIYCTVYMLKKMDIITTVALLTLRVHAFSSMFEV
jgi:hypothetical protein